MRRVISLLWQFFVVGDASERRLAAVRALMASAREEKEII